MTKYTLEVELKDDIHCDDCCCCDSEWNKCRAGNFNLVEDESDRAYCEYLRPENCPLKPVNTPNCGSCINLNDDDSCKEIDCYIYNKYEPREKE